MNNYLKNGCYIASSTWGITRSTDPFGKRPVKARTRLKSKCVLSLVDAPRSWGLPHLSMLRGLKRHTQADFVGVKLTGNALIRPISVRYPAGLSLRVSERILVSRLES
jgi:hypothetical protein